MYQYTPWSHWQRKRKCAAPADSAGDEGHTWLKIEGLEHPKNEKDHCKAVVAVRLIAVWDEKMVQDTNKPMQECGRVAERTANAGYVHVIG